MVLRLSKLALGDLEDIYDFTVANWDKSQAEAYIGQLWAALGQLQQDPLRWRLRPDIHAEARATVCGRHLVIYRVRGERIEVARVLHGAMDIKRHIPRGFIPPEG